MNGNAVLSSLARRLHEAGFENQAAEIRSWVEGGTARAEYDSVGEMLKAQCENVWWDFNHVGEIPSEWLKRHPRPDQADFAVWANFERAEAEWKKAASAVDRAPFEEAEEEILAADAAWAVRS